MEDFNIVNIEFENAHLTELIQKLKSAYYNRQNSFAELCTAVAKIYYYCKENSYKAKDNEYYDATKLLGKFGFQPRQFQRLVQCYEKFVMNELKNDDIVANLRPVFFPFSSSKLFELVSVSNEQLIQDIENKLITPDMTVKQIRQYVKKIKGEENEKNKVLEDASTYEEDDVEDLEFYNHNNHYDIEFFEMID